MQKSRSPLYTFNFQISLYIQNFKACLAAHSHSLPIMGPLSIVTMHLAACFSE